MPSTYVRRTASGWREGVVLGGRMAVMMPGVVIPSEVALIALPRSGWDEGVGLGGAGIVPRYSCCEVDLPLPKSERG